MGQTLFQYYKPTSRLGSIPITPSTFVPNTHGQDIFLLYPLSSELREPQDSKQVRDGFRQCSELTFTYYLTVGLVTSYSQVVDSQIKMWYRYSFGS